MKRKLTLLLFAAGTVLTTKSQVMLTEDFNSTFVPGANDWHVVDNTVPGGVTSWTTGNQTGGNGFIPSFNGNYNDFYMADFTAVNGTAPGVISAFLITPTLTIYNGAVLQFATRTLNQAPNSTYPDRLQVLMSQSGNSVIPAGVTSVGSFTDMILDINPNLTTNNASAVSNGSVNGYPFNWVVYSLPISGVTGTVTGRFAFRYYVTSGGVGGLNSRLVGVDGFKYTLPCGPTVPSFTACAGASTTLQATGLSTTTYSWNTGATTSSLVVNPSATTVYSLYPSIVGGVSCGNVITATITTGSQMVVNAVASSPTICAGETVTLTAAGAASYTWGIGTTPIGSAQSITVAPSSTTNYSVVGQNGIACYGLGAVQVTVVPNPTVSIAGVSTLQCVSGPSVSVTFTGNGASSYVWFLTGNSPISGPGVVIPIAAQTATTPAIQTLTLVVLGEEPSGCASDDVFELTIARSPTVTIAPSPTGTICTNSTITLTGNGADTYLWTGAATGTDNPISVVTPSTAGTKQYSVTGTDANTGCTGKAVFSHNVVICNLVGIDALNGYEETSIYPNPFLNEIKIDVLDGNVVVYNAIGQAVISSPVRSSETLNTADLAKGAYVVKAYNSKGELVKSVKLIKN